MVRLTLVIASIALLGCKTVDPKFCELNPDDDRCKVGGPCTENGECVSQNPNLPVCDKGLNGGTCVACSSTEKGVCSGTSPHCDNNACVACVNDTQDCNGSGVCLLSGACADPSRIIHASVTGSAELSCGSLSTPCTLEAALVGITPTKDIVKLDSPAPAMYAKNGSFMVVAGSTPIIIDARNAILQRNDSGPILTINVPRNVTLLGGIIQKATGSNGDGITCGSKGVLTIDDTTITINNGSGIKTDDCTLSLTRMHITNNNSRGIDSRNSTVTLSRSWITSNDLGGINIDNSKFIIVGNAFLGNGDNGNSPNSAVEISTMADNKNRLDFNTIAHNTAQNTVLGITCASNGFVGRNNIIWMNSGNSQVGGNCKYTYSVIGPTPVPMANDGMNNNNFDPKLTSATDPHLMPQSPASQKVPEMTLEDIATKDIDGEARTAPYDIGADQYYPKL